MNNEKIKDFTYRVSNATKSELIVITFEIMIDYIDSAIEAYGKNDMEDYIFNINKAKQFCNNNSSSLDFNHKLSFELLEIYMFFNKILTEAVVKKTDQDVLRVKNMMCTLKDSFKEVSALDNSEPLMKGKAQIYAGLTYGKNSEISEVRYKNY